MKLSEHALRFATIFRREASRTSAAMRGIDKIPSLERAAFATMKGYDLWAAAAVDRYMRGRQPMTTRTMVHLGSALSRSPMCEVAWTEHCLGRGVMPQGQAHVYDRMASRYKHVRRFPKRLGSSNQPLTWRFDQIRAKVGEDPVQIMLWDDPWIVPEQIFEDPAYSARVPAAANLGELDWDGEGLLKRVDHEMLVIEARFDPGAAARLNE